MADLDELLAHATPRPWRTRNLGRHDSSAIVREGEVAAIGNTFGPHGAADARLIVEAVNSIEAYKAVADAAAALIDDVPGYALRGGLTPAEQTRIDRLREALARVGHTGKETA